MGIHRSPKMGRPKKNPNDLVKNQLIAIDETDYLALKQMAIDQQTTIKKVVNSLIKLSLKS